MKWSLCLVLVAEFLLFDRMTSLHCTWIYPRWNDQIQYLTESYTGYEDLKANGFLPGIGHALAAPAAQGKLHSILAILAFEAAGGPSRSAALAVNMIAFIAWQAALAFAVLRGTGSRGLAWVAVGLTLGLKAPWAGAQGSATDFRLDHLAMCMMGIALAAGLRTEGFRKRGWSLGFGIAVGMTLLSRFLTVTYFVLILCSCLAWVLASRGGEGPRRARNLGLAALVAAGISAPSFWFNSQRIYFYYWILHFLGPETAIRDTHLSLGRALLRLFGQLGAGQLGAAFGAAFCLVVIIMAFGVLGSSRKNPGDRTGSLPRWPREAAVLGAIFLSAPALVLALQNDDFSVVLGVAVPGAVVLVLALGAGLRARAPAGATAAAALAALAVGGGYFVARQAARPYDDDFATGARTVNAVADRIFRDARASGIAGPRVAVDQVTDCFDGQILRVICYERHKVWLPLSMTLPTGIIAAPEAELMERLAGSDFVFATEGGATGPWPYDQEMLALRPKILAWCNAHMRLAERFTAFGRSMALYERPESPAH